MTMDRVRQTDEQAKALAEYIITWLQTRNGSELRPAVMGLTVESFENMRAELNEIIRWGGKPPHWVR